MLTVHESPPNSPWLLREGKSDFACAAVWRDWVKADGYAPRLTAVRGLTAESNDLGALQAWAADLGADGVTFWRLKPISHPWPQKYHQFRDPQPLESEE